MFFYFFKVYRAVNKDCTKNSHVPLDTPTSDISPHLLYYDLCLCIYNFFLSHLRVGLIRHATLHYNISDLTS